jgi:zinc/manganese transport system permease protein
LSFLHEMLSHDFMLSAFEAGTVIALVAGPVGYLLVLRTQIFAADALGHVAFTGALAALVMGFNLLVGLFAASVVMALGIASFSDERRVNDVVIGSVFAWILGLGVLFLGLYVTYQGTTNSTAGVTVLFGSILGLRGYQATAAAAVCLPVVAITGLIFRPLLFSSLDPQAAAARRVPVRLLGLLFMVLVALTVAEATQAVGALLIVGLLAMPAAVAQRFTTSPLAACVLASVVAMVCMWAGLTISYTVSAVPPSFAIIALLFFLYVTVAASRAAELEGLSKLRWRAK